MEVIWWTRDRLGREVTLTDEGLAHILSRRSRLASRIGEMRDAVERADHVARDVDHPHRDIHYHRRSSDRPWLRVVVHYRPVPPQGTWVGRVITAHYFSRSVPS